ncbi:hypothetical protein CyaNS01_02350 [Cyanobium sp. NS01]|nr:hypothetical protein CyaNS01_02350 [Cyanobium sp. NS01]
MATGRAGGRGAHRGGWRQGWGAAGDSAFTLWAPVGWRVKARLG